MLLLWGQGARYIPSFNNALQSSLVPSFSIGSATPTFTRASTAYVWGYGPTAVLGVDSPILLSVDSGEARFVGARRVSSGVWSAVDANGVPLTTVTSYTDSGGPYGYLSEGARTNLLTYSNDFTNAAWAKVTMTTAMTSTGPDGVVNSATRLTATGALSTILQPLVAAASDRTWSVYMRRITGTGTIKLFQGATKTADLASSLNGTTYTLIQQDATVDVTLLGVGIEIGTSGDAVDVWCGQFEAGAFASSPIPTTTVAVTRAGDVLTYPGAGNIVATVGGAYAEISTIWTGNAEGTWAYVITTGGSGSGLVSPLGVKTATNAYASDTGAEVVKNSLYSTFTGVRKRASSWSSAGMSVTGDGATPATDVALTYGVLGVTIGIGCGITGNLPLFGTIRNLRTYPAALSSAQLTTMTT